MFPATLRIKIVWPTKYRVRLCAIALSCVITIANAPISGNFNDRLLAAHNTARARVGLPPLRWNPQLAETATLRASELAASHIFKHAPENAMSPQGENIWGGTKGYYSPEDMVNAWADEKHYFKIGIFPDNSTTGKIEDVGHFTQMIWRDTTEVGCGVAEDSGYDILVCRYNPAGNFVGEKPF